MLVFPLDRPLQDLFAVFADALEPLVAKLRALSQDENSAPTTRADLAMKILELRKIILRIQRGESALFRDEFNAALDAIVAVEDESEKSYLASALALAAPREANERGDALPSLVVDDESRQSAIVAMAKDAFKELCENVEAFDALAAVETDSLESAPVEILESEKFLVVRESYPQARDRLRAFIESIDDLREYEKALADLLALDRLVVQFAKSVDFQALPQELDEFETLDGRARYLDRAIHEIIRGYFFEQAMECEATRDFIAKQTRAAFEFLDQVAAAIENDRSDAPFKRADAIEFAQRFEPGVSGGDFDGRLAKALERLDAFSGAVAFFNDQADALALMSRVCSNWEMINDSVEPIRRAIKSVEEVAARLARREELTPEEKAARLTKLAKCELLLYRDDPVVPGKDLADVKPFVRKALDAIGKLDDPAARARLVAELAAAHRRVNLVRPAGRLVELCATYLDEIKSVATRDYLLAEFFPWFARSVDFERAKDLAERFSLDEHKRMRIRELKIVALVDAFGRYLSLFDPDVDRWNVKPDLRVRPTSDLVKSEVALSTDAARAAVKEIVDDILDEMETLDPVLAAERALDAAKRIEIERKYLTSPRGAVARAELASAAMRESNEL